MARPRISDPLATVIAAALAAFLAVSPIGPSPVLAQDAQIEALQQRFEALRRERKWAEAIPVAAQLADLSGERYGKSDRRYAAALYQLGRSYESATELGETRYRRAEQALKQAIEVYRRDPGPNALETAAAIHLLADVYDSLDDWPQAYLLARQAYDIRRSHNPDSIETATSLELMAVIERAQKRPRDAEKTISDVLAIKRKATGENSPEYARALYVYAGLLFDRQEMRQALPAYRQVADILERHRGPYDNELMLGNAYLQLADVSRKLESFADAESYFSRAIEVRERLYGTNHTAVAAAYEKFAQYQAARSDKEAAARTLDRAIAIYKGQQPPNLVRAANAMSSLGFVFSDQQWLSEAEDLHRQALEIRREHDKARAPQSLFSIAVTERAQGRPTAAEQTIKEALALIRANPNPSQGLIISAETVLAGIYSDLERYEEAEALAKSALDYRIRQLGKDADSVALSHNVLAGVQRAIGKYDEAADNYKRAMEIRIKQYSSEHAIVAGLHSNLGGLNRARKRYAEAEQDYLKALAIYQRSHPDNPVQTTTLLNLAILYSDQGRHEQAIPLVRRALDIRRAHASGPTDARVAEAEARLADLYIQLEKYTEAEDLLRKAIDVRRDVRSRRDTEEDLPLAVAYEKLADTLVKQKRNEKIAEARDLLHRAIAVRTRLQGAAHTDVFRDQHRLAQTYQQQGNIKEFERLMEQFRVRARSSLKEITILFGTDRKLVQKPGTAATFGSDIGDALTMGRYPLGILPGAASSSVQRVDEKGEASQPAVETSITADLVRQPLIVERSAGPLIEAAKQRMRTPGQFKEHALIFVHGFNVKFEDAIEFTGRFAWNLNFTGSVFLYSWPSNGRVSPRAYISDQSRADAAASHLATFIQEVVAQTGAKKVHIVAHSMGNRAVLHALKELASKPVAERLPVGAVILASPDVVARNFKQSVPSARKLGGEVTLYASSKDWPLWLSHVLARDPAAGYFSPREGPLVMEGVWTIDISETAEFWSSNHSTFAKNQKLISDINVILATGEGSPEKRASFLEVVRKSATALPYWVFRQPKQ
jgi:esterase/lipase superfamily enzyme